jgi:hypothetical protein
VASGRPLNYTTTIPVTQTAGECQAVLAAAGASSVAVHYEDGLPSGLSFSLRTPHGPRNFTLPVDVPAMQAVLAKAERNGDFASLKKAAGKFTTREHAANVAWRVVKDWLEANLALIAAQMATLNEVMLPYLHVDDSRTLWQAYQEREQAALLPGSGNG